MRRLHIVGVIVSIIMVISVSAVFAQEATQAAPETKAWLGVAVQENESQVVVAEVRTDSPASEAGLLEGDVITSVNSTVITSTTELSDLVDAAAPGDVLTLEIVRDGETQSIEVTLGTRPARGDRGGRGERGFNLPTDALSAAERLLHADLAETDAGFEVTAVSENHNHLALEVGDVIISVNNQSVAALDTEALVAELAAMETPELSVVINRAGEEVTLTGETSFGGRGGRGNGNGGDRHEGRRNSDDVTPTEEAPIEVTPEAST